MSRDIIRKLKSLKQGEVSPREEWLKTNREFLLSQVKNTVPSEAKPGAVERMWLGMSIFLPKKFVFDFVRPLAILLIVAIVGTSGWIATVDASYEALPGDWLYPAKRVVEKTQLTVAVIVGNKETETKLHSEFAKRRATELKKMVINKDPKKQVKLPRAVVDLKTQIENVNNNLEEIKNNDEGRAEAAKEVNKTIEQVTVVLTKIKEELVIGTSTESKILLQDVAEAKDMSKDTAVKAVEVMVIKHLEGDSTMTKEEVKTVLDKSIHTGVTDIAVSQQNMVEVNTAVEAVKVILENEIKDLNVVTGTPAQEAQQKLMDDVIGQNEIAGVKTEQAAVEADKKLGEAMDLLAGDNLSEVVDKIREASETSKSVEKMQDDVLDSAQSVLPLPAIEPVQITDDSDIPVTNTTSSPIDGNPDNLPITLITATGTPTATTTH